MKNYSRDGKFCFNGILTSLLSLASVLLLGACGASSESTKYEISVLESEHGAVSPTNLVVSSGMIGVFNLTPDNGYAATAGSGCGGTLIGTTYTTSAISQNCAIEIIFGLIAPLGINVSAENDKATLSWNQVSGLSYSVYYAKESGISPTNYSTLEHGTRVDAAISPLIISNLDQGAEYFFVVTANNELQESAPSQETTVTIPSQDDTVTIPNLEIQKSYLNDTGSIRCNKDNDYDKELACPLEGYPEQDPQIGRDAQAALGMLVKVGSGVAGFDFTKISNSGDALPSTAQLGDGADEWACVQDNVTGLMWEIKTNDPSHLRYQGHTYSWYNPDATTNGGHAGTPNGGVCLGATCDTQGYVDAIRKAALCGYDDWRLPTVQELLSIVNNSVTTPTTDREYFPNTTSSDFWTSIPSFNGNAWSVRFGNGGVYSSGGYDGWRVRLVRGDH